MSIFVAEGFGVALLDGQMLDGRTDGRMGV